MSGSSLRRLITWQSAIVFIKSNDGPFEEITPYLPREMFCDITVLLGQHADQTSINRTVPEDFLIHENGVNVSNGSVR